MSRRYDPKDMCEMDKLCLDRIIQEYWTRPETMFFDDFFFDHYLLYEFTKKELIYMDINGDIPFHMLSFAKDDEEFAAVRRTIVEKNDPAGNRTPISRATVEDTNHCTTES